MKSVVTVIILILLFYSCLSSDELTHSKAGSIIKECVKKEPLYGNYKLELGKKVALTKKEKVKAQILADKGIIKFVEDTYLNSIELTDKSERLLLEKEEKRYKATNRKYIKAVFKTCEYKFEEIIEIKETPAFNEATVRVKFRKINETEISELEKNKNDFLEKEVTLRKTSNGWKLCD